MHLLLAALLCAASAGSPEIVKKGVIECDLVEATPLVYQGALYRFEYVRDRYKHNPLGEAFFRLVNMETGESTAPFAKGYHLGSAYVEGDRVYVYGVHTWGADSVRVFWTDDLKTWQEETAIALAGWTIFNTSVCKGREGYRMAIEIGAPPEVVGQRFTMYFAKSEDAIHWERLPMDCVYTKDRYSACPALRFYDDYYYMVYLEHVKRPHSYVPHIVRTKDFTDWESSPKNPMMSPGPEDKQIANPKLSEAERKHIAEAKNLNNSDLDFCAFGGKTIIYYSWGNQEGIEFLAEAEYAGSEQQLLESYFK